MKNGETGSGNDIIKEKKEELVMEKNRPSALQEILSFPVIAAVIGAVMVFAGTYLELFHVSALGYRLSIRLSDLNISSLLTNIRIICVLSAVTVLIPKIPNVVYSAFSILYFALFLPKVVSAFRTYSQVNNVLSALGIQSIVDVSAFLKRGPGYYLLFIGTVIMALCCIYFILKLVIRNPEFED